MLSADRADLWHTGQALGARPVSDEGSRGKTLGCIPAGGRARSQIKSAGEEGGGAAGPRTASPQRAPTQPGGFSDPCAREPHRHRSREPPSAVAEASLRKRSQREKLPAAKPLRSRRFRRGKALRSKRFRTARSPASASLRLGKTHHRYPTRAPQIATRPQEVSLYACAVDCSGPWAP